MGLIHQVAVTMELLNANIDDDLIFNGSFNTIRRESDAGYLTVQGGSTLNNGGFIRLYGDTGGGALKKKIEIGEDGNIALALSKPVGFPANWALFKNIYSDGTATLKSFPDPTDAQDVATKNYVDGKVGVWSTFAPTLTWSGTTPTTDTSSYRYCRIGNIVFVAYYINFADSNSSSLTYATLPVNVGGSSAYLQVFNGFEQYGTAYGSNIDPKAWVYTTDATKLRFLASQAGTDGQPIRYVITGFYEVA